MMKINLFSLTKF